MIWEFISINQYGNFWLSTPSIHSCWSSHLCSCPSFPLLTSAKGQNNWFVSKVDNNRSIIASIPFLYRYLCQCWFHWSLAFHPCQSRGSQTKSVVQESARFKGILFWKSSPPFWVLTFLLAWLFSCSTNTDAKNSFTRLDLCLFIISCHSDLDSPPVLWRELFYIFLWQLNNCFISFVRSSIFCLSQSHPSWSKLLRALRASSLLNLVAFVSH